MFNKPLEKKKVIIVFASIGSGHKIAAMAIKQALDCTFDGEILVEMIDVLDFLEEPVSAKMRDIQKNINVVTGPIYDYFWKSKIFAGTEEKLEKVISYFSKRFEKYLLENNPRVIISTHVLASILISYFKKKGMLRKAPQIAVSTDLKTHLQWPTSGINFYIVASLEAKRDLIETGIPVPKIKVWGIPLRSEFATIVTKKEIAERYFGTNTPVVLFLAGSFQNDPYRKLTPKIWDAFRFFDENPGSFLHFIAGNNLNLKRGLEKHIIERRIDNVRVYGFVEKISEIMKGSVLLITKAGGLICAEALAMGLPMLLIGPHFGQERANTEYLVKYKSAVELKKNEDVCQKIKELLVNKNRLFQMALNSKKLSRIKASEKIGALTKNIIYMF